MIPVILGLLFRTFDGKSTAKPPKANKLALQKGSYFLFFMTLRQYLLSDSRFGAATKKKL